MMGTNNLAGSPNMQELVVEDIFVYPDYFWSGADWNIALLKMSSSFVITNHVRTVCIPGDDTLIGATGMVTGWGETESGGGKSFLIGILFLIGYSTFCPKLNIICTLPQNYEHPFEK